MTLSLIPHEYKTDKRSGRNILVRTNPYIRLRNGEEPPIFVQEGKFYYENGDSVEDPPDWVIDHLSKMSASARTEVGLPSSTKGK